MDLDGSSLQVQKARSYLQAEELLKIIDAVSQKRTAQLNERAVGATHQSQPAAAAHGKRSSMAALFPTKAEATTPTAVAPPRVVTIVSGPSLTSPSTMTPGDIKTVKDWVQERKKAVRLVEQHVAITSAEAATRYPIRHEGLSGLSALHVECVRSGLALFTSKLEAEEAQSRSGVEMEYFQFYSFASTNEPVWRQAAQVAGETRAAEENKRREEEQRMHRQIKEFNDSVKLLLDSAATEKAALLRGENEWYMAAQLQWADLKEEWEKVQAKWASGYGSSSNTATPPPPAYGSGPKSGAGASAGGSKMAGSAIPPLYAAEAPRPRPVSTSYSENTRAGAPPPAFAAPPPGTAASSAGGGYHYGGGTTSGGGRGGGLYTAGGTTPGGTYMSSSTYGGGASSGPPAFVPGGGRPPASSGGTTLPSGFAPIGGGGSSGSGGPPGYGYGYGAAPPRGGYGSR